MYWKTRGQRRLVAFRIHSFEKLLRKFHSVSGQKDFRLTPHKMILEDIFKSTPCISFYNRDVVKYLFEPKKKKILQKPNLT